MNLFYQPKLVHGISYLEPEESRHAIRVLRKKHGDHIRLTDGKGVYYDATITEADSHQCSFKVTEKIPDASKDFTIHIAISPTKNIDRIEWFVEKAVELGIDEISLMECDHTERQHLKVERLEKMAISAMKQSLRARLPAIHPLNSFRDVILSSSQVHKFIAHVDAENQEQLKNLATPRSSYVVLIGPEGDFSDEELALADSRAFKKVSLGPSRLRTETAGLAACHILNLANTP